MWVNKPHGPTELWPNSVEDFWFHRNRKKTRRHKQTSGEGEHGTKLSFFCNWIEQINNKASSLWLPQKSEFIHDVRMARSVGVGHCWDNSTSCRRLPTTDHPAVLKQIALFFSTASSSQHYYRLHCLSHPVVIIRPWTKREEAKSTIDTLWGTAIVIIKREKKKKTMKYKN